ncbi:UV DNA damage repair endonuclease UvsE [Pseudobacteroides cellulosolvens]|uniref:UV-endonuclease UvdE n=1 Tax=Pseudobacteroides cellulosolvens ATCC 35603 = DSM 2933 TaxID=398512 RepID=A0A0L6JM49_9FIRM|nr:UV DNA damage repair endonuclease UvsE [Pseudobacteroides cellulosolvens]KNY26844.1 UV-endonuclease UvdE [Pseudobacteroides cellulosolvens ATCC 35603 = DSM 2933]
MAIGYACITIGVEGTKVSRCIIGNATLDNLRKITNNNLAALMAAIDYNIAKGIKLYRISSDIIPFGSHPVNKLLWWDEYGEKLLEIGQKIADSGMRVSMHPGQYTVLNSTKPEVVNNAVSDLIYHTKFLDALGVNESNKLILHIGGVYGDKEKSAEVFKSNYLKLPDNIKARMVIENDDKNYTLEDALCISRVLDIPVIFDNLHNKLNPSHEKLSEKEWIDICASTWKGKDGVQKIHYSQQKTGAAAGSHSETIYIEEFMEFYNNLNDKSIDIMLEVKDKNISCVKCINSTCDKTSIKDIEEEWAKYKYFVLSRSAKVYQEVRELLKDKKVMNIIEFYRKIELALHMPEDKGAEINAAQHVWGYLGKNCKEAEKRRFNRLIKDYTENGKGLKSIKSHLLKCAEAQNVEYLKNSYYFFI